MKKFVRIHSVTPLNDFHVHLEFTDGTSKDMDLSPYLHGPIFDPIKNDMAVFRTVKVDERAGTIVWENGADIDPDVLYMGLKPEWMTLKEQIHS